MMRMMLEECGVNVGIEDVYGRTALYTAITSRKVQSVRVLLDAGEDVNRRTYVHNGRTVLSFAVSRGEVEVVKLLLERGADVKRLDRGARSALGIAVSNGNAEIVRMLLKAGAKVSDGASGHLAEGPLVVAQRLKDPTIHCMLIDSGGLVNGGDGDEN
jgi:ankyrin repeat protein